MVSVLTLVPIQYISKSLYTDTEPPPCCKSGPGFTTKNNLVSEVGSDFWKKSLFGIFYSRGVSHEVLLSEQAIRFVPMYD